MHVIDSHTIGEPSRIIVSVETILPRISGQAWIIGESTYFFDPRDPFRHHPPFPRPPVFTAFFVEATTGRLVRPDGSFRSLPQKANSYSRQ